MNNEYFTKSELTKDRGWNTKLICELLGEPDLIKCNPHYLCAAPMKLWLRTTVLQAESSQRFHDHLSQSAARKAGAQKAVATKTKNLTDMVLKFPISVPLLEMEELEKRAIDHFNYGKDDYRANSSSDIDFLDRITVNYLRHVLTDYEDQLHKTVGKVGKIEAYSLIKNRILREIGRVYPYLELECIRQSV